MRSDAISPVKLLGLALLLVFMSLPVGAQTGARVQISSLDSLAARASETVDVNIDERLLRLAGRYLSGEDRDEAQIKELVAGLKGIYVRSFEFE